MNTDDLCSTSPDERREAVMSPGRASTVALVGAAWARITVPAWHPICRQATGEYEMAPQIDNLMTCIGILLGEPVR